MGVVRQKYFELQEPEPAFDVDTAQGKAETLNAENLTM